MRLMLLASVASLLVLGPANAAAIQLGAIAKKAASAAKAGVDDVVGAAKAGADEVAATTKAGADDAVTAAKAETEEAATFSSQLKDQAKDGIVDRLKGEQPEPPPGNFPWTFGVAIVALVFGVWAWSRRKTQ
jgi:hypothetical protein